MLLLMNMRTKKHRHANTPQRRSTAYGCKRYGNMDTHILGDVFFFFWGEGWSAGVDARGPRRGDVGGSVLWAVIWQQVLLFQPRVGCVAHLHMDADGSAGGALKEWMQRAQAEELGDALKGRDTATQTTAVLFRPRRHMLRTSHEVPIAIVVKEADENGDRHHGIYDEQCDHQIPCL